MYRLDSIIAYSMNKENAMKNEILDAILTDKMETSIEELTEVSELCKRAGIPIREFADYYWGFLTDKDNRELGIRVNPIDVFMLQVAQKMEKILMDAGVPEKNVKNFIEKVKRGRTFYFDYLKYAIEPEEIEKILSCLEKEKIAELKANKTFRFFLKASGFQEKRGDMQHQNNRESELKI